MTELTPDEIASVIRNPFHAIEIHPVVFGERPAFITEDQWVEANARLIEEEGLERWMRGLLATLRAMAVDNEDEYGH